MNMPKLRFKEFSGEWQDNILKSYILSHKGGASFTPEDFIPFSKYEVIPKKAISSGGKLMLDTLSPTYCKDDFFKSNYRSVINKSYLITTLRDLVPSGPNIGYIVEAQDDKEYILAQGVYGFKISDQLNRNFLIQFSNTAKYRSLMKNLMVGSTQVHIRNDDFFNLPIFVAPLPEQTKIASFLTAIDERIAQLTQKHVLLNQYKKGMMQQIFSQQLRFKDDEGREFAEWEEKELRSICIKIKDGTHFSPKTFEHGEYKYLTSKNIKNGYLDFSNLEYLNKADHEKIYSSCDVKKGDVLLTKDGTIGQCCINELEEEFSLLSSVAFLRVKPQYNNYFLYHILVSDVGQSEINKAIAGQALKRITLTKINDFKFYVPSLPEQTKIAKFLSSIDHKIDQVAAQLDATKQYKRGLLQQMFV